VWTGVTRDTRPIRDFQQCGSLALIHGARWSDRHCIPFVRGPPLPVFQRLAGMRVVTRDRFLRPHGEGEGIRLGASWAELLAKDYCDPRYHISFGDFAAHTPGSL